MKIIKLQAENFKRLRAVEIEPSTGLVAISGRNAQGKSSVLDAIQSALGGVDNKSTPRPIRDGADSAQVVLELDELTVTRTWRQGQASKLVVKSKDGVPVGKAQATLDGLLGKLSFDPLEFASMDAKAQVATLLQLVRLPFDPAKLDAQRAEVFTKRTDVNRHGKQLEARLATAPQVPEGTPDTEVSVSELLAQYRAGEQQWAGMERATEDAHRAQERVTELEEQLLKARHALEEAQQHRAAYDPARMPDMRWLQAQLDGVEATNANVRTKAQVAAVQAEVAAAMAQSRELTAELERLDKIKRDGLAAAAMPIAGLSFNGDGVTYNGVPFKQASSAEQLRVSLAMAMALNPGLRVIRISDGSLLDSANLKLVADMAAQHDYQVWLEMVDESGDVGFVIEDGAVANV